MPSHGMRQGETSVATKRPAEPEGVRVRAAWAQAWDAANLLSLARVPLELAAWLAHASPPGLVAVLSVAGVTDVLDGRLARRAQARAQRAAAAARIGARLDPICDKVFMAGV